MVLFLTITLPDKKKKEKRMNQENAKAHIKKQLPNYLEARAINIKKTFQCLNPEHEDKNPSMSYYHNGLNVHCFSCSVNYDIFDLIGIDYKLQGFPEILSKAQELYGVTKNNLPIPIKKNEVKPASNDQTIDKQKLTSQVAYCNEAHKRITETNYPKKRGLDNDILNRFGIGYDPNFTGMKALIIPTSPHSYVARNTNPRAKKKDRYRKTGPSELFNPEALADDKPVFIVEGEIDAMSIMCAGGEALALGSTSNVNKFLRKVEESENKKCLIISLDNDKAGQKAQKELIDGLKILYVPFLEHTLWGGSAEDANEAIIHDSGAFAESIKESIKKAKIISHGQSCKFYLDGFIEGIKSTAKISYIPTGFERLDYALGGGLYQGLYIIGAISSLGKTTFILQVADNIAKHGEDVLIFSLEMQREELMAKSISRHTFYSENEGEKFNGQAKTTREVLTRYCYQNSDGKAVIDSAINNYKEYANNVYIYERGNDGVGTWDIERITRQHVENTGKLPVIIIDYLQILKPRDERTTDKQNTDKTVGNLKSISNKFSIPIIGISSLNRDNYTKGINMAAFKESGAIEYSSDVLLGLQFKGTSTDFDVEEAKQKTQRDIELVILKQRNGVTGSKIDYEFYTKYNYFRESVQPEPGLSNKHVTPHIKTEIKRTTSKR